MVAAQVLLRCMTLGRPRRIRAFSARVGARAQAATAAGAAAAEHDEGWGGEAAPMDDDFDDLDDDLLAQDPWVLPRGPGTPLTVASAPHCHSIPHKHNRAPAFARIVPALENITFLWG